MGHGSGKARFLHPACSSLPPGLPAGSSPRGLTGGPFRHTRVSPRFRIPMGHGLELPIFYSPNFHLVPRSSKYFGLIEATAYTDLLCITSYPSVAPSRTRSCITTRQRPNRPPARVGANAVLNSGYIAVISAVPGISRIAIHSPATRTFPSTSSSSRIPVRRATSRVEGEHKKRPSRCFKDVSIESAGPINRNMPCRLNPCSNHTAHAKASRHCMLNVPDGILAFSPARPLPWRSRCHRWRSPRFGR